MDDIVFLDPDDSEFTSILRGLPPVPKEIRLLWEKDEELFVPDTPYYRWRDSVKARRMEWLRSLDAPVP